MRSKTFWLVVCVLALGCSGHKAPTVLTAESPASEAAPAIEIPQADQALAVDGGAAEQISNDPKAQCQAGETQACRTLCRAEAAICDKGKDKGTCKAASQDIQVCPTDPNDMRLGHLCRLPPSALSPAQAAVGMLATTCKSRSLEKKYSDKKWKLRRYLMARPVPVVLGPGGRHFLTDRHHLSTALLRSGIDEDDKNLYICPMVNRVGDEPEIFWRYMVKNNFTWLHDNEGKEIPPDQLPPGLDDIGDDPFRTLSRWVRDSCGYIKCGKRCGGDGEDTSKLASCEISPVAPDFLEFLWADYMRNHRDKCEITDDVYKMPTTQQAAELPEKLTCLMTLARQDAALDLPGWNNDLIKTKEVVLDDKGCEK